MTPQQPATRTKAVLAMVLLVLLGAVCIGAGQWQLRRAHEREALLAAIEAGRRAPAQTLDAQHRDGPDWHPASARGHWLNPFTVLLDNRNLKGLPGLWVATPLELQDSPGTAVLVLRGWVARPLPPAALPDLSAAPGTVLVRGTLLHRVPRLFDLGSLTGRAGGEVLPRPFPAADGVPPRVQNLPLDALAAATGLDLLPVVLQQAPTQDANLIQDWPGPSTNAGQNYNYALQWFSFAAIALIAAGFTAWRTLRRPTSSRNA
ncbi:SURF1 family protein [Castellaniella sp.]|uniref:SURF1 family protein n=1 Tax=Castellaniella sp. TaxID=1955812 RepID=UPI002D800C34|nr:SURF1 family protein [Castellaniella sp.]HET8702452.1 SURF1 family protein [Castellaniella sp.]